MYKVTTKEGEELYYNAKRPKDAQAQAEAEGHKVAMVTKSKSCGGEG